jgi:uncharacterized protein YprB with RNaseH-like and TPR domain
MIQNTFQHFAGIGEKTERKLWEQGVLTWDQLEEAATELFSQKRAALIAGQIDESREAFESNEFRYFTEKLKSTHTWRVLPHVTSGIAFLDIETTGLGFPPESHTTSVAIMVDGKLFVEHEQAAKLQLIERVNDEAKLIVSFNGLGFDLPFLRRETGLLFDQCHLDLCVWLRRHDVRGGLKKIQLSFPHLHQRSSMDIDGFDAVRLWRMHQQGVPRAIETLMTYNAEDTICLEPLMREAYQMERNLYHSDRPVAFALPEIKSLTLPRIETKIDSFVYSLLRGEESWNLPAEW